jgi:hypothetical protein
MFQKLNSRGMAHLILPMALIAVVAVGGVYALVSRGSNLTSRTELSNTTAAVDPATTCSKIETSIKKIVDQRSSFLVKRDQITTDDHEFHGTKDVNYSKYTSLNLSYNDLDPKTIDKATKRAYKPLDKDLSRYMKAVNTSYATAENSVSLIEQYRLNDFSEYAASKLTTDCDRQYPSLATVKQDVKKVSKYKKEITKQQKRATAAAKRLPAEREKLKKAYDACKAAGGCKKQDAGDGTTGAYGDS